MPSGIIVKNNGKVVETEHGEPLKLNMDSYILSHEELFSRAITSIPPSGAKRVLNLYVIDGKLKIEYEE